MRYWWVNQNQTFRHEYEGGYLWSPKRNRNGARNRFYENMREVSPGDMVISFRDTRLVALSVATSFGYDAQRPEEFGATGDQWNRSGWRVDARYTMMPNPIRPKDHISEIRPLLPSKYGPLTASGDGKQSVYLAELPEELAELLLRLLQNAGNQIPRSSGARSNASGSLTDDDDEQALLFDAPVSATDAPATEADALVKARRGQGLFRERVLAIETKCRVTGVSDVAFLVASHIKPWRHASNDERLDGSNGLALTPTIDRLFDKGFIGFEDDGTLVISPVLDPETAHRLGLPAEDRFRSGTFSPKQCEYLWYHRENILKRISQ